MPWEVFEHVISFCDPATLVAVSLVSFQCWQLAGPILYEDVKIEELDGLGSLFFIEPSPPSSRLAKTRSFLSRIRTLTLDITSFYQSDEASFESDLDESGVPNLYSDGFDPPRRLLAHTADPLPLRSLLIPDHHPHMSCFPWLAAQVLPFLNPVRVVHRHPTSPFSLSTSLAMECPTSFLLEWTVLERIEFLGDKIIAISPEEEQDALYSLWTPPADAGRRRTLHLVLSSTEKPFGWGVDWRNRPRRQALFLHYLQGGGATEELAARVDLRVVIQADGAAGGKRLVQEDVPSLP